jgi:putative transposase
MKYLSKRFELLCKDLLKWAKLSTSKYHTWLKRYGKINGHNGKIPRNWWLEEWEKQPILDFHDKHPLKGYRRLTSMMLDYDIVAVSPSSTYRVLKNAGRLDRRGVPPSK